MFTAGKKQFLAEYRGKRMIPIPILLYAFEIVLVSTRYSTSSTRVLLK